MAHVDANAHIIPLMLATVKYGVKLELGFP